MSDLAVGVPTGASEVPGAPPSTLPSRLPLPLALLVAVLAGAALAASFPSLGWWPLAPIGVAGLMLAARGHRSRAAALLGLVTGLAFFLPHLRWSGVYVGVLPWAALSTLEAAYLAAMAALLPLAWRAPFGRAGVTLAVSGLWVAQEAARSSTPFGGFPWGRLAFSQSNAPTLGLAAVGGGPLVSAAVAAAGALLALIVIGRPALPPVRPVAGRVACLAALVAVLLCGTAVPRVPTAGGRQVDVAAVQGDVPKPGLDFNAERRAVLDNHARATTGLADRVAAGSSPRPDLVVWPENSSDIDPLLNADAAEVISAAVDRIGVPTLVGTVLRAPPDNVTNTSIVWGPRGSAAPGPGQRYSKQHPAPFGEYIPYRSFFRLISDKVDLVRRDFLPGTSPGLLDLGPAKVGDVICFEVAYDDLLRTPVLRGADLLVVQTNNATFGFTDESVQQLAMSRLRAVEYGRAVVHVSTVGVSALIAPDGRMLRHSGLFSAEVLAARLPLRTTITPAARLGPVPQIGIAALGLLLVAAGTLRGRRARS